MPGYYVHLAATNPKARRNNSFVKGIIMPDLLKAYVRKYGLVKTKKKYNEFATILRQHNVSSHENAFDKLVNIKLLLILLWVKGFIDFSLR